MASCHTHAPTELSSHRSLRSLTICEIREIRGRLFYARSFCVFREFCGRLFYTRSFCEFREFRGRTLRNLTICGHLCASVGGSSTPEAYVNSVGEPTQPNHLCASVRICGRLFSASSFCVFREFRGRITMLVHECSVGAAETAAHPGGQRGYGRDAIPSYDRSVGVVATQRGHGGMPCPLMSLFCGFTVCLVSAAGTAAPPKNSATCLVGALLAPASGKAELGQLHTLISTP